jgi:plasmid stabilization system protein ParE
MSEVRAGPPPCCARSAGIHLIAEQPLASQRTDDPDVRVKSVRRYRYRIFYSIADENTVEIVHVRHTSRRPWTSAL